MTNYARTWGWTLVPVAVLIALVGCASSGESSGVVSPSPRVDVSTSPPDAAASTASGDIEPTASGSSDTARAASGSAGPTAQGLPAELESWWDGLTPDDQVAFCRGYFIMDSGPDSDARWALIHESPADADPFDEAFETFERRSCGRLAASQSDDGKPGWASLLPDRPVALWMEDEYGAVGKLAVALLPGKVVDRFCERYFEEGSSVIHDMTESIERESIYADIKGVDEIRATISMSGRLQSGCEDRL